MNVFAGFEIALGLLAAWIAWIYWTTFTGETFWRVLSVLLVCVSVGAFVAAGMMVSHSP